VFNLLKFISRVGIVAGRAISASVASMMIIALGLVYISISLKKKIKEIK